MNGNGDKGRRGERSRTWVVLVGYALVVALYFGLIDTLVWPLATSLQQLRSIDHWGDAIFIVINAAVLYWLWRRLDRAHAAEREGLHQRFRAMSLLQELADASPDAMVAKDRQGRYTLFSRGAERKAGVPAAQALGRDASAIFPAELARKIAAVDERVMALNRVETYEEEIDTVDGRRTFLTTKGPLHDDEGQVVGMYSVSRDITERAQVQLKLAEQLDELRRWQAVMLGREERLQEVKREVNELLAAQGLPARYQAAGAADEAGAARQEVPEVTPPQSAGGSAGDDTGSLRALAIAERTSRAMLGVLEDRERAADEARAASQRLELAAKAASVGIWEWNLQTDEWIATPVTYAQLGWPSRPGWSPRGDLTAGTHPKDRAAVVARLRAVLKGDADELDTECRMSQADGSYLWIAFKGRVLEFDEHDRPSRMLGVSIDRTERKAFEQALREAEAYRRTVFENLAVGVVVFNAEHVEDINRRGLQLLGYTLEELKSLPVMDLVAKQDRPAMRQSLAQPQIGPHVAVIELVRRDGGRIFCEVTTRTLDARRLVSIVRDVTESRAQEQRLRLLWQALEQSSESIVITDLAGQIEYANAAALAQTGYAADELLGRNPRHLQSGRTPRQTYDELWAALGAGLAWKGVFHNRRKDGSEFTEFATVSPVRSAEGEIVNFLAVKEDVTEKMRMGQELDHHRHHLAELVEQRTAELALATRAAEAANEAKSTFLAAMSHEIRTPMNGVLGIVDVLRQSDLSPYQADLAETIRESALALLGIIEDILDFSKIEARRMTLELEPVALTRLVEGVCDSLLPVAAASRVRLSVFVDPGLPERIVSDKGRLRLILNNLLGNAIKFSARSDRTGHVQLRAEPDGQGRLRLQVIDDGIGMTPEELGRVFLPFEQAENSTTRRYGGTGLGLSICKGVVDLFEGAVDAQSALGAGSTFAVTLPLQAYAAAGPGVPLAELAGLECHVMARDAQQARDWCVYLGAAGANAQAWPDLGAVHSALAATAGGRQVVVVEAEDKTALAQWEDSGADAAVVLVTAGSRGSTRRLRAGRVILAGDAPHRDALVGAVALASGRAAPDAAGDARQEDGTAVTTPGGIDAPRGVVLVAEDNALNGKVVIAQLALLGLGCEVAADGTQALARWRASTQGQAYSLLLTDLDMPGMDGYELTAKIRAEETVGRHLPIVALSANALSGQAERCLAAGMDGFLSKPVRLEALSAALAQWLPATPALSVPIEPWQETRPADFDPTVLASLVGDDKDLLADLRRDYVASAQACAEELRAAVARGDCATAGAVAHRLKSSSRAVGALALADCCDGIESAGKSGNAAALRALEPAFDAALATACAGLQATHDADPAGLQIASAGVLLVDDEPFHLRLFQHQLSALGVERMWAMRSGADALEWLQGRDTSALLLLLDLNMPGMDGVEFMRHLAERRFAGTLALVSGADSRVLETASKLAGAYQLNVLSHLKKPVSAEALSLLVERWRRYTPGRARRRRKVYAPQDLERAIDVGNEIVLHYQPKVRMTDGKLVGVEALVRWQHPHDGMVYPDSFIGVAETHGLIDALTRTVLDKALAQQRRWRDSGLALQVAVNVSMSNLSHVEFSQTIFDLLLHHGVAPTALVLEVTESQLLKDSRAPMHILTRLRLNQVGLSIDDFGTGHSSLAQLRDMPFDELKIDRSFVHGSGGDPTLRAIFSASLAMAHELGLTAVAEGVEDRADWDFVRGAGCDVAQGYFIARPMPAGDLPLWAAQWPGKLEVL